MTILYIYASKIPSSLDNSNSSSQLVQNQLVVPTSHREIAQELVNRSDDAMVKTWKQNISS